MQIGVNVSESGIVAILESSVDRSQYVSTLKGLADDSRTDLHIRKLLGSSEVLQSLVDQLSGLSSLYDVELEEQLLRCIGNGCAMQPEAIKAIVDQGLSWTQRYTNTTCDGTLQATFAKVLYNITGADFTSDGDEAEAVNPALKACYDAGLHAWLITRIAAPENSLDEEMLTDMLFWISASATEEDPPLADTVLQDMLVGVPTKCTKLHPDPLATLLEAITTLCRVHATRTILASHERVGGLYQMLEAVQARTAALDSTNDEDKDHLSILLPQLSGLTWLLSDVSAEPSFAKTTRLNNTIVKRCIQILQAEPAASAEQLRIASNLILGNALLNMPDEDTSTIVRSSLVNNVATNVLQNSASPDLLYATAGFLTMLCRPTDCREHLGQRPSVIAVAEKLCKLETPQIREAGIRLVKALGRDNADNQMRLASVAQLVSATSTMQLTNSEAG